MGKPTFSVIIPTLNEEIFLPKILTSLAAQTKRDFEVIVVDGSSTDKTVKVAKSFEKHVPKLSIVESKIASLPLQRNLGGRKASGEWLVFVDADSILAQGFIERINYFIKQQQPDVFTTWFYPDSNETSDAILTLLGNLMVEASILFHRSLTPGALTVVTRRAFDLVGGYNEALKFGEDYDFGQRLVSSGVNPSMLRETLCMFSLRRFRREGKLKILNKYILLAIRTLLTKKPPKEVSDYIMGGHLYEKGKV